VRAALHAISGRLQRGAAHIVFGSRSWSDRLVRDLADGCTDARVLEIGSGRQDLGHDSYSVRTLFGPTNSFVQSDVNPAFGHDVVDVTTMGFDAEFDVVVCMYVLEHVFDVPAAAANIHRALVPGGRAVIAVPHVYPYHDEPIDFWRFTEHSLRRLLSGYADVRISHAGPRRLPKALLAIATK